ncbi:MAG: acetoin utilization protein AcuC [Dehalococcoidia bacterium]|nr:acetoin utilization protein AcuC [Dehalococcoidia bacterium]
MKPIRLKQTYELLQSYKLFENPNVIISDPTPASKEDLLTFHSHDYINAIEVFNDGNWSQNASNFNLGPGDNPVYKNIFDASRLSTGGSIVAAKMIESGKVNRAFNISGGLHHAMPNYAYGFCVFNDPVIAINQFLQKGLKVAYIDIDCHHGDGVQLAFYDTDAVLTISIHESGQYLFPGTGWVEELGTGKGKGYSVNLPLHPYSSAEIIVWAFKQTVLQLINKYNPDILVTQLGIDSHFNDPITHLNQTAQGFESILKEFAKLPYPWLAMGGGGYDAMAVARCWSIAFSVMSEQTISNKIPVDYFDKYGVDNLYDIQIPNIDSDYEASTKSYAENSVREIHKLIFPTFGIR